MKIVSILSFLVVLSCAQFDPDYNGRETIGVYREHDTINPVFQSYIDDFVATAQANGFSPDINDIPINFKDNLSVSQSVRKSSLCHMKIENRVQKQNGDGIEVIVSTPAVGVCTFYNDYKKDILISRNYWDNMSESQRRGLIFHELGHCAWNMDRDHNSNTHRGYAVSLMHPNLLSSNDYDNFFNGFIQELLFQNENSSKNLIDDYLN